MSIKTIELECDYCGVEIDTESGRYLTIKSRGFESTDFCNFSHLKLWLNESDAQVKKQLNKKAPVISNILEELAEMNKQLDTVQIPEIDPEPKEFLNPLRDTIIIGDNSDNNNDDNDDHRFQPHPPIKTEFVSH